VRRRGEEARGGREGRRREEEAGSEGDVEKRNGREKCILNRGTVYLPYLPRLSPAAGLFSPSLILSERFIYKWLLYVVPEAGVWARPCRILECDTIERRIHKTCIKTAPHSIPRRNRRVHH
jgi:hypothetical protein